MASSHCSQSGHHEPLCSVAFFSQSASETSFMVSLVQYWYLPAAGGLTTPAIWPDPDSTYFIGPPKNCDPYSTESAGAIWISRAARLLTGTFTFERWSRKLFCS